MRLAAHHAIKRHAIEEIAAMGSYVLITLDPMGGRVPSGSTTPYVSSSLARLERPRDRAVSFDEIIDLLDT
jgi:hypothetical protein